MREKRTGRYRSLIRAGWRTIRDGGWRLAAVFVAGQLIVAVVAAPVLHWLFAEALRAAGLSGLEISALPRLIATPLSAGLIAAIVVIAFLVLSMQFIVLVVAAQRAMGGRRLLSGEAARQVARVARKLVRPSGLVLLPYLFLLLPLGGIGFLSVLSQAITIPSFISGELVKTAAGLVGYSVFLLVLLVLNVRFALTVPLFATTDATAGQALRRSWRLMGGHGIALVGAMITVFAAGALLSALVMLLGIAPVALADAAAPDAAPVLAAVMLALVEACGVIIVSLGTAMIVGMLLDLRNRVAPEPASAPVAAAPDPRRRRRRAGWIVTGAAAVLVVALSAVNIPLMDALSRAPQTLVIAHRGATADAVENTISSLRAAREIDADFVEMDVMETADGQFVVMHDANLSRLADLDAAVGDLTLDELTALTVHDAAGRTGRIPSLAEYATVARDIGQPLLIEIKLHGGEGPDLVPRLIAELESLGVLEDNIYHSLDGESVEALKRERPELTVGLTMALAGIGVPDTSADFLVIEEWSFTDELRDAAHRRGLAAMVWTVDEEQRIRELMRDDVDGIITDIAAEGVGAREAISGEDGLADVLFDAMTRYVAIL